MESDSLQEVKQVLVTRESKPVITENFCLPSEINDKLSESLENLNKYIKRSETQESVVATTETDGSFNHQIKYEAIDDYQLFGNLANNKDEHVEELNKNSNIDDEYSFPCMVSEDVSNLSTETETKLNIESKTEDSTYFYEDGKLTLQINHNSGNIFIKNKEKFPTIRKYKVKHPDGVAYSADKKNGNCLLNAICLDKDIQDISCVICGEFHLDPPESEDFLDKYKFLYTRFQQFFKEYPDMTRFRFLSKLSKLADVSHLCEK